VRAVLFDLDGTLLDIDIGAFLPTYFGALAPVIGKVMGDGNGLEGIAAVQRATQAMMDPHPPLTNREAFNERFTALTGIDLEDAREPFDHFYAEVFPTLGAGFGPAAGAHDALRIARDLGMKLAVATNPIFPMAAVLHRMRWAGVEPAGVDVITAYEAMHACKPSPEYFLETADLLGVPPGDCLMVGDDPSLDMSAADVGMRTFYVGGKPSPHTDYEGTLADLAKLLPRLAAE
jgi:FMN phosphatase YigB (HAD superfamily)